jgi:L-threonylcarbamoyladenylate synthase
VTVARELGEADVTRLETCLSHDGTALLPTDTVYGIACDAASELGARRIYELKGRPADRPAAVMFLSLAAALAALPELATGERSAVRALLPGALTLLLPNRARRFPIACGPDPETLGLRVPALARPLAALGALDGAVLQSSANLSGQPDARRLGDVARELRDGVDMELDAGELPGVASTVIDLRDYERGGGWSVLRVGAVSREVIAEMLDGLARGA